MGFEIGQLEEFGGCALWKPASEAEAFARRGYLDPPESLVRLQSDMKLLRLPGVSSRDMCDTQGRRGIDRSLHAPEEGTRRAEIANLLAPAHAQQAVGMPSVVIPQAAPLLAAHQSRTSNPGIGQSGG